MVPNIFPAEPLVKMSTEFNRVMVLEHFNITFLESTLAEFLDEFMTPAVMAISVGEYRRSSCDI
jgi:hypothetical protein